MKSCKYGGYKYNWQFPAPDGPTCLLARRYVCFAIRTYCVAIDPRSALKLFSVVIAFWLLQLALIAHGAGIISGNTSYIAVPPRGVTRWFESYSRSWDRRILNPNFRPPTGYRYVPSSALSPTDLDHLEIAYVVNGQSVVIDQSECIYMVRIHPSVIPTSQAEALSLVQSMNKQVFRDGSRLVADSSASQTLEVRQFGGSVIASGAADAVSKDTPWFSQTFPGEWWIDPKTGDLCYSLYKVDDSIESSTSNVYFSFQQFWWTKLKSVYPAGHPLTPADTDLANSVMHYFLSLPRIGFHPEDAGVETALASVLNAQYLPATNLSSSARLTAPGSYVPTLSYADGTALFSVTVQDNWISLQIDIDSAEPPALTDTPPDTLFSTLDRIGKRYLAHFDEYQSDYKPSDTAIEGDLRPVAGANVAPIHFSRINGSVVFSWAIVK